MTHIVTEACVRCKYTDCVQVCPVDCFFEGPDMLVIDPDQCIDCGVCVPECPAGAIYPDNAEAEDLEYWAQINQQLSRSYTNITEPKPAPADADHWNPLLNPDVPSKKEFV